MAASRFLSLVLRVLWLDEINHERRVVHRGGRVAQAGRPPAWAERPRSSQRSIAIHVTPAFSPVAHGAAYYNLVWSYLANDTGGGTVEQPAVPAGEGNGGHWQHFQLELNLN